MHFIEKEILAGELVPVLLGQAVETNETAKRIFRQYRLVSHVFCERKPRVFGLTFCTKYHTVRHGAGERLLLTALLDFAAQLGNADVILYLIPCTVDYANFVWRYREDLEPHYVIADWGEMQKVWYGEDTPDTKEETR